MDELLLPPNPAALDTCGCCAGAGDAGGAGSPPRIWNRPGLPGLAYRVGTHPAFLRRMLARLPHQRIPDGPNAGARPLASLSTRAADDPALALLDAWAVAADILTFYQERLANEGYLRTAVERRSILELGRAIGYELRPGVAASAFLAFQVESPPPLLPFAGQTIPLAPGTEPVTSAIVPSGTRVQSVPAPGQQPQTFETLADFTARPEWNALRPRLARPQRLALFKDGDKDAVLYMLGDHGGFDGAVTPLPPGKLYLIDTSEPVAGGSDVPAIAVQQVYASGTSTGLKAGELLLLVGGQCKTVEDEHGRPAGQCETVAAVARIARVVVEHDLNRTRVDLDFSPPPPPPPPPPQPKPQPIVFDLRALVLKEESVAKSIRNKPWRERDLRAFMGIQAWRPDWVVRNINWRRYTPPAPPPKPPAEPAKKTTVQPGAFSFASRSGFFGDNAPAFNSLPESLRTGTGAFANKDWDDNTKPWDIWHSFPDITTLYSKQFTGVDAFLDHTVPDLAENTWTVFEEAGGKLKAYWIKGKVEASLAGFALSARATGLSLATVDGTILSSGVPDTTTEPGEFKVRTTTAHVQSFRLDLLDLPIADAVAATSKQLQLNQMVLGLSAGQPVALTGERSDLPGVIASEIAILSEVLHEDSLTTLFFQDGLRYSYVRTGLTLNANVTRATHGETVQEPLGGGDAGQANQSFTLKRPPLTYISAPTGSGAQDTLTVRVDGVAWSEVASLYELGPRDQGYLVRIDDDGATSVVFGDGIHGARPPTAPQNISAVYRTGIGLGGLVDANKLTLLQVRPLGIQGVTNPVAAGGAAEREDRDGARRNAPRTVLTLDRIVSLRDFEDYARAFAGIGKAQAEPLWQGVRLRAAAGIGEAQAERLWQGERHLVVVTVAAAAPTGKAGDGTLALATNTVDPTSDLYDHLCTAMRGAADPVQPFQVVSYTPNFFNVTARVLSDQRYVAADVFAAVTAALQSAFGFERRELAQPVTAAEIIQTIHTVPGVVAANLRELYLFNADPAAKPPPQPEDILPAGRAHWSTDPAAAEGGPAAPNQLSWPAGCRADPQLVPAQLLLVNPVGVQVEALTL